MLKDAFCAISRCVCVCLGSVVGTFLGFTTSVFDSPLRKCMR